MTQLRNQRRSLVASFVAATLAASTAALVPHVAQAQMASATLEGTAPPGTKIIATDIATGASRVTIASKNGNYILIGLPPGRYRVKAGKQIQELTLSVASTLVFDFTNTQLRAAELKQITISGRRLIDVKTPAVGGIVTHRMIETVPEITRNFLGFADILPGISFTYNNGDTSFRGGTQESENNNVYIGGMPMTNFIQGGITGQGGPGKNPNLGDPGNPFPQSAIASYRVINSNYSAQYAQASSAIIVAQTKSGTNHFHGDAFVSFTNQNLRALTPAEQYATTPGDPKAAGSQDLDYGVSAGGPIIKNKAHYFFAYEHKFLTLPNTVYPSTGNGIPTVSQLKPLLPANVWSQFGPTENPFHENLLFAKIDYEPGENDRLSLTDLYRTESMIDGAFGQTAASAANAQISRFNEIGLSWLHASQGWTNKLHLFFQTSDRVPLPSSTRPQITYQWFNQGLNATLINVNGQSVYSQFKNKQRVISFYDNVTLPHLHFFGTHTLQFGVSYQGTQLSYQDAGQGEQIFYAVDSTGTYSTPYQASYTDLYKGNKQVTATSNDNLFGIYLQDDWAVNKHLTFNLGARYDYQTVPIWQNFVTPQPIVSDIYGPYSPGSSETYAQALALGGINISNYISNGHNRSPQSNEFQPRLGFSYDIEGNGKYVIFGGYAKAYAYNNFDIMSLETTKAALAEPTLDFYGGGYTVNNCLTAANASPTCIAWNPAYTNLANLQALTTTPYGEIDMVNNNLKTPYSNQFSLGFRTELGEWNASITLSEIDSYNRVVGQLGNRTATGSYFVPSSWGAAGVNPAWGGIPGTTGNLVLWNNGGRDTDKQVLVFLEKPYTRRSGWSATIAYTYSDAYQNDYYSYFTNNAYLFDLPKVSMYPMVPSSVIPKNRLVITGSVDGPWGIIYGAKLTLATPVGFGGAAPCPTTLQQCHGYWDFPTTGFPTATWGERNLDLQATKYFNLHLYGSRGYVRVDVFNVFNTPQYAAANFTPKVGPSLPPQYVTNGPIYGVPLTLKFTVGINW